MFEQTLEKPWEIESIPRAKKQHILPRVLSKEEVFALFKHAANKKHLAMLMLVYSSGLRVSELAALKPENIIADKMRLRIDQSKGNKDRYTILSKLCLAELGSYWTRYRPGMAVRRIHPR